MSRAEAMERSDVSDGSLQRAIYVVRYAPDLADQVLADLQ